MPVSLLHLLLGVLGGVYLAAQAPINAALARRLGHPVLGAAVSFAVGLVALSALTLVMGLRPPPPHDLRQVPPHLWLAGGCLGVAYMVTNVTLVPRMGVAAVLSLAVAGQMLAALVVDRFGLLGVDERAVTPLRALGAVLLVAGVALITRR